ncbi:MAG: ABC transporter permease [Phycisphaerales bacterium]|nr:ABC transporter permease [Phycisphaerales bacterium]
MRNPAENHKLGVPAKAGLVVLGLAFILCIASLPFTLGSGPSGQPRYNEGELADARLPPVWAPVSPLQAARLNARVPEARLREIAESHGLTPEQASETTSGPCAVALRREWVRTAMGTDAQGRSLAVRVLLGGAVSLAVGVAAALLSVVIGTLYGALAGYAGGWLDGLLMRVVDVLYGLPYVLLVVLLAVAGDSLVNEWVTRQHERASWVSAQGNGAPASELREEALRRYPPRTLAGPSRRALDLATLLVAIGGVSWLSLSRVVRGQVMSLRQRPFVEAARAMGASPWRLFWRHLMPNLLGPVMVYATLTIPQAMLQESFLSFLGIGVPPPVPSWGSLAAEGLGEINPYESSWWLPAAPGLMLAATLLALNFVGEALRRRWVR